nr:hypothetical protein [Roseomonas rosulenta]
MRATIRRKARVVHLVAEPVSEARIGEGRAVLSRQERDVIGRRVRQGFAKVTVHLDRERRASLPLHQVQHKPLHVRPAHADHVAAALAGVEHERERQARHGAQRPARLELRDLCVCPRAVRVLVIARLADVLDGVVIPPAAFDRVAHELPKNLPEAVRHPRRLDHLVEQRHDVPALHVGDQFVPVLGAQAFQHVAVRLHARRRERAIVGRCVVVHDQRAEAARDLALQRRHLRLASLRRGVRSGISGKELRRAEWRR